MKFIDIIKEDDSDSDKKKYLKKVKAIMRFYEEGEYTYKLPDGDEVELKYRLYHFPEPTIEYNQYWGEYRAKIQLFMSNLDHVLLYHNNQLLHDDMAKRDVIMRIKIDIIKNLAQHLKKYRISLLGKGDQ